MARTRPPYAPEFRQQMVDWSEPGEIPRTSPREFEPLGQTIRILVKEALASLDGRFGDIYSEIGRPSTPPEQLLQAMLLQAFYSVRFVPRPMKTPVTEWDEYLPIRG